MSNCINSGINKIFVLTQFNSASLNRHLARTYFGNGVNFGDGFVEVWFISRCVYSFELPFEKWRSCNRKLDAILTLLSCYAGFVYFKTLRNCDHKNNKKLSFTWNYFFLFLVKFSVINTVLKKINTNDQIHILKFTELERCCVG